MQLYARNVHVVKKDSLFLRLRLAIFGRVKIGESGSLKFYAFKCPVHGLTMDYAHGYDSAYLDCKYCNNDYFTN